MKSTRRDFLQRAGAVALGASGIYGLAESAPARAALDAAAALPPEQHILRATRLARDNGIELVVPSVHHQVVTANLRVARTRTALREAQAELEAALRRLERDYAPAPAGLAVIVAWGLGYFREYLPTLKDSTAFPLYLPIDNRASREGSSPEGPVGALTDAIAFASDADDLILEQNDVAFLFQSDSLAHVSAGAQALLSSIDGMLDLTSVRKGFVGAGVPRRMATAAGIPGAASIPERAELFLGFTSTQRASLGADRIVNFETIPKLTDQWPNGYFRQGTIMHLSHIYEDLEAWYARGFSERVTRMFRPGLHVRPGTLTVPERPRDVEALSQLERDGDASSGVGHSGSIQPANRVARSFVDNYGARVPKGAAILHRGDFNTLDNPFFWSADPERDRFDAAPAAGLHFVAFAPTSDTFARIRAAMDGSYPDGTTLATWAGGPRQNAQGFNAVLRPTHRQNFIVPPRRHRSFPLAERA